MTMRPGPKEVLFPGLLLLCTSCNLLIPVAFFGEHKKKVLPEFDKLGNSRVAVLVWTDPSTLFDYPFARLELATYVAEKLRAEMAQRNRPVNVIDPSLVEDFLQKDLDAQIDPLAVGRKFDVDYVVYLEVLTFQMRNPHQPQFLRGEIQASVSVHDVGSEPDRPGRFELTPVTCIYPDGAPVLMNATNPPLIREATYRKFAEEVARKFYEHTIDLG